MEDAFNATLDEALSPVPGDSVVANGTDARRFDAEPGSSTPGMLQGMLLAVKHDWFTSELIRSARDKLDLEKRGVTTDRFSYDPTPEELTAVASEYGIPSDLLNELAAAGSPEHMVWIAQNLRERLDAYDQISKALPGVLNPARLAVNAVDPVTLIAGAGIGNVTKAGTFIGRFGQGAATSLAVDGPLEAVRVGLNPVEDSETLAYSLLGSAIFGGLLNQFGGKLTPDERMKAAEAGGFIPKKQTGADYQSVGAARVPGTVVSEPLSDAAQRRVDMLEASYNPGRAFAPSVRFDLEARLNNSDEAAVRELTQRLIPSQTGLADGAVNRHSAFEAARRINEGGSRYHRKAEQAMRDYWAERGRRFPGMNSEAEFYRQVGMVIDGALETDDVHINKAADAYRDLIEYHLNHVKDSRFEVGGGGVSNADFEDVKADRNYFPRLVNYEEYGRIRERLGGDMEVARALAVPIQRANLEELRARASERGTSVWDEAVRVAQAYLATVRALRADIPRGGEQSVAVSKAQRASLRERAKELAAEMYDYKGKPDDMDDDIIDDVINMLMPEQDKAESARARRRLALRLRADEDGDLMRLWEWDARHVTRAYGRHMSGLAGLLRAGFRSESEVRAVMNDIRISAEQKSNTGLKKVTEELDHLDYVLNSIMGRRTKKMTPFDEAVEMGANWLKRWAFTRYLNNVGFSQLSELGAVISQIGFTRTIRQIPAVWKMYRQLRRGEEPEGLVAFADAMYGAGSLQVRNRLAFREGTNESADINGVVQTGSLVERIDDVTKRVTNVAAKLSGLSPLTELMRLTLISGEIEWWAQAARSGGRNFSKRRMAYLGLDENTMEAIHRNLEKAPLIKTPHGGRVRDVRIDEWDDQEAAMAFINAIDRNSRRVVLEGDLGGRARWMEENPIVSIALQFLNFTTNAYTKHTLFGLNIRDYKVLHEFLMMTIFGGIGYMARVYAISTSMSEKEKEEFLSRKATPSEIGKAAFYYSGHSSIIPFAHDTLAEFVPGYELRVATVRASTMRGDLIDPLGTTPVFKGLNDLLRGIQGITRDGEIERNDIEKIMSGAVPFQNAWYLGWLLNPLVEAFPEDDDKWLLDE